MAKKQLRAGFMAERICGLAAGMQFGNSFELIRACHLHRKSRSGYTGAAI